MKIHFLLWAAILVFLPAASGLCDAIEDVYDMPLAEADDLVTEWLDANGFQHYRPTIIPGKSFWLAEKGQQQLRITAGRWSPLAARIRIEAIQGAAQSSAVRLQQYLQGYLQLPNRSPASAPPPLPQAVRGHAEAVVCIYAVENGRQVQLTGFAVDIQGVIVCTGHDLETGQAVDLRLHDGNEIAGTVVKLDRDRDLALIQTSHAFDKVISLRNGRFMINEGDALFFIACSGMGIPGIQSGFMDGPSRRVAGFPLWQVRMPIAAGSSGSPVFDDRGRLAAVVRGRYRGKASLGFLIPFETLLHFLERY